MVGIRGAAVAQEQIGVEDEDVGGGAGAAGPGDPLCRARAALGSLLSRLRSALRTERNVRFALLFGSAATGADTPASDVDVLVDLRDPSLERLADLGAKLEAALGAPSTSFACRTRGRPLLSGRRRLRGPQARRRALWSRLQLREAALDAAASLRTASAPAPHSPVSIASWRLADDRWGVAQGGAQAPRARRRQPPRGLPAPVRGAGDGDGGLRRRLRPQAVQSGLRHHRGFGGLQPRPGRGEGGGTSSRITSPTWPRPASVWPSCRASRWGTAARRPSRHSKRCATRRRSTQSCAAG